MTTKTRRTNKVPYGHWLREDTVFVRLAHRRCCALHSFAPNNVVTVRKSRKVSVTTAFDQLPRLKPSSTSEYNVRVVSTNSQVARSCNPICLWRNSEKHRQCTIFFTDLAMISHAILNSSFFVTSLATSRDTFNAVGTAQNSSLHATRGLSNTREQCIANTQTRQR